MANLSTKEKLVKFLSSTGPVNTLTSRSAKSRFGVKNLRARIAELRQDGYPIYTNRKTLSDGRTVSYYKLGNPSDRTRYVKNLRRGHKQEAIRSLYRR